MLRKFLLFSKALGQELILGTLLITQLYPFKITQKWLESKALGKKMNFNFLSTIRISEINNLQKNTILQSINVLNYKEKQISFLKRYFIQTNRRTDSK